MPFVAVGVETPSLRLWTPEAGGIADTQDLEEQALEDKHEPVLVYFESDALVFEKWCFICFARILVSPPVRTDLIIRAEVFLYFPSRFPWVKIGTVFHRNTVLFGKSAKKIPVGTKKCVQWGFGYGESGRNPVRFGKSARKYSWVPRNVWSGGSGTGNLNMKLVFV